MTDSPHRGLGWLLATLLLALAGCPQPLPPTPTPVSPADGPFAGAVVECDGTRYQAVHTGVLTCLDLANTGDCLAGMLEEYTPAQVACEVRDVDVELHKLVARQTATDVETRRAQAASAWIWSNRIGYREIP